MNNGMNQAVKIRGGHAADIDRILAFAKKRFPTIASFRLPNGDLVFGNERLSVESLLRTAYQSSSAIGSSVGEASTGFDKVVLSVLAVSARRQKNRRQSNKPAGNDTPDLFSVFQNLFPLFVQQGMQSVFESSHAPKVSQNWLGNVAIGYAIEDAESYQFVSQEWFDNWNVSIEELHAIAVNNLEETILSTTLRPDDLGNPSLSEVNTFQSELGITVLTPRRASVYNASHILSPIFRQSLSDILRNDWLVAIPARDLWITVSKHVVDDNRSFAQLQRSIAHYYSHWPQPIDKQLYQVTNDGVSIWNGDSEFLPSKAA